MKKIVLAGLISAMTLAGCGAAYAATAQPFIDENNKEIDLFALQRKGEAAEEYIVIDGMTDQSEFFSDENVFGDELIRIVSNYSVGAEQGSFFVSTDMLTAVSDVSAVTLNESLNGTGLYGLGAAFKQAEEDYGVNAIFLMGLAMHESNGGLSYIARMKNNLFGFQAYDSSPYASARTYRTREESIDHVARYISQHYLTPGGAYFEGYSVEAMNVHYATDPNWARGIKARIAYLLSKMPVSSVMSLY